LLYTQVLIPIMSQRLPFWFQDEDRKKYFQIQPDHVAPSGAQYSHKVLKRKASDQIVGFPVLPGLFPAEQDHRDVKERKNSLSARPMRWLLGVLHWNSP
jgi:hypothetical protein